jgi:hypothetical protein
MQMSSEDTLTYYYYNLTQICCIITNKKRDVLDCFTYLIIVLANQNIKSSEIPTLHQQMQELELKRTVWVYGVSEQYWMLY